MTSADLDPTLVAAIGRLAERAVPGGTLRRAWALAGGISSQMTAFEVGRRDGRLERLIARRYHPEHLVAEPRLAEREFALLRALEAQGVAAPRARHVEAADGGFGEPVLVTEYIEGEAGLAPVDRDGYLRQYGAQLAAIHQLDATQPGISELAEAPPHCPVATYTPENEPAEVWQTSRIRAALAAAGPRMRAGASVLVHGDYWPGNALWRDGALVAVIDWEDAERGDPLADLGRARSELVWIFGPPAMQAFTEAYRDSYIGTHTADRPDLEGIDAVDLAYWDLCAGLRAARLLDELMPEILESHAKKGRGDLTEAGIQSDYRWFVDQAIAALR